MICKICLKQFEVKNNRSHNQLYCSKKCNKVSYARRNKERLNSEWRFKYKEKRNKVIFPSFTCVYCGKTFQGKNLHIKRFCSKKCLKSDWAKRNRVHMREKIKQWYHDNLEHARSLGRKYAKKRYNRCRESILQNAHIQNSRRRGAIGSHTFKEWNECKVKNNFTCKLCGKKEPEIKLTRDHIIPIKKGGSNFISNIQPLCISCNCSKGAR
jgi:5-methylcytosine-specific restriction endonuclease McrA